MTIKQPSTTTISIVGRAEQVKCRCAYCKCNKSSFLFIFFAHSLTTQDFDLLCNRGWCRSGNIIYLPNNELTCCPQYSMRVNATKFCYRKKHRRILKQFQSFLEKGEQKLLNSSNVSRNRSHSAPIHSQAVKLNNCGKKILIIII